MYESPCMLALEIELIKIDDKHYEIFAITKDIQNLKGIVGRSRFAAEKHDFTQAGIISKLNFG